AGNGFFKPNISTMVGNLYPAGSPLRDAAYNIFYMGINIGALLAPMVAEGLLQLVAGSSAVATASDLAKEGKPRPAEWVAALRGGSLAAFSAAAVGMTVGTVLFALLYRKLTAVERRHAPADHATDELAVTEDLAPAEGQSALQQVPERNRIIAL